MQARLSTLVETLNKKDEYHPIASLIAETMADCYPIASFPIGETTAIVAPLPSRTNPQIADIAQTFAQEINLIRIKKLLLSTARGYWETDPLKINHADLKDLIDELRQRHATIVDLSAALAGVVKTLNKPMEYALVAETIVKENEAALSHARFTPRFAPRFAFGARANQIGEVALDLPCCNL
ncbi:MAG: hypothetical protein HC936_17100 [Leptolyngbyaceae cyanobacterium SU_3_3]|nr:hypothetical protein [Leptolyngbyaceae cyanobacterium SU_3_3]